MFEQNPARKRSRVEKGRVKKPEGKKKGDNHLPVNGKKFKSRNGKEILRPYRGQTRRKGKECSPSRKKKKRGQLPVQKRKLDSIINGKKNWEKRKGKPSDKSKKKKKPWCPGKRLPAGWVSERKYLEKTKKTIASNSKEKKEAPWEGQRGKEKKGQKGEKGNKKKARKL